MNKPFPITNAMREKVADQLTVQAVATHGPKIARALELLNEAFWRRHIETAEELPGLDRKHWAELIQRGAVCGVSTCCPERVIEREGNSPVREEIIRTDYHSREVRQIALVAEILGSTAYSGVSHYIVTIDSWGRRTEGWRLRLQCQDGAVPRWKGFDEIHDSHPIVRKGLAIKSELLGVFEAASKFRQQVMGVLQGCRSSRQVEDLFPEAAKLLPQPARNEKALAPTELIQSVRSMLDKGVPPVVGA